MQYDKKLAIFYILDILKEYTDEDHPLTQKEIGDKLKAIYDVELERKSIASNLYLLMDTLDYDVTKTNEGFYLGERELDDTEIKFLIDAVFTSKMISGKEAQALSKKLSSILSKYKRKDYNYIYKSTDVSRTTNKDLFYNIDIINEAIYKKRMISFKRKDYDKLGNEIERFNGYEYKVSPYFMINNIGNYYLVGKDNKHPNYVPFKVDYIKDIKILDDEPLTPMSEVEALGKNFNITEYINNHVYIFGGEVITAKLELVSDAAVKVIKDWFGTKARFKEENGKRYATVQSENRSLFYWVLQYQEDVVVIEPQDLRDRVINRLKETLKNYE